MLNLYGDIAKFDTDGESLLVSGILSTPAEDKQGDIVSPEAMRKALGDYLLHGTCREMHQPIAAGKPISAYVDDEGKTHVTVKVVDKGTIAKVKEGILKGFSIGGKVLKKVGKTITELHLKDASLVDVPANPQCAIEIFKFDKPGDRCSDPECKHHVESATEKCASCMSKAEDSDSKCSCGGKMSKGMEKCKKCMAKSAESEELDNPHEKSMKKMLCKAWSLSESITDEDFEKEVVKRMANPSANPMEAALAKMETAIGRLEKSATEANERATVEQRKNIISKMQRDGRVAMKNTSEAYKLDELQKMDLSTLEILAVNAPQIPLKAAAIFKADNTAQKIDPALKGDALIEAVWESRYGDLETMKANFEN